jgi:hypothetical protein
MTKRKDAKHAVAALVQCALDTFTIQQSLHLTRVICLEPVIPAARTLSAPIVVMNFC